MQTPADSSKDVPEPVDGSENINSGSSSASDDEKPLDATVDNSTPSEKSEPSPDTQEANRQSSQPNAWQAIWSPQYNAYYFYNSVTNETTWTNPLHPEPSEPSAAPAVTAAIDAPPESEIPPQTQGASSSAQNTYTAAQQAAVSQGIDPSLAHLDPSFAASGSGANNTPSFTAKFNARTGRFTAVDGRNPEHMSEYERARRMSEFYFDVDAWQQDVDQRHHQGDSDAAGGEEIGRKRKRPTKKDLERFAQRKKERKLAKTAWLRT